MKRKLVGLILFAFMGAAAHAALVAEYDMTDGDMLNDSTGSGNTLTEYNSSAVAGDGGVSLNADGYASFTGAGYLAVDRANALETGTFTVSYWWRASSLLAEANFEGPSFSSETGNAKSFQFTTIGTGGSGNLEVRDSAQLITSDTENYPDGVWYNTVIQSSGGSTFDIWISAEGGTLTQVGNDVATSNGGLALEDFIFGANRAKNAFGTFDLANVKIYDDADVAVATLLAEGSGAISRPTLRAFYDFGDGDLLNDSSGNGNTATIVTNNAGQVPTLNGDDFSAHFDGSGGNGINAYLYADLNIGSTYTVSFWWKTDQLNQNFNASMASSTSGTTDWQIQSSGGAINLFGDNGTIVNTNSLATNTWYHTAVVSEVTPSATNVSYYITERGAETVRLIGSTNTLFGLDDLRIGVNRAGNLTYDCDIALVRVYDTVATDTAFLNDLLAEGNGDTTALGTPKFWLDQYDLVSGGDYEAADLVDADLDGLLNWEEYLAGTVPTDAASVLKLNQVTALSSNSYAVAWQSVAGKQYDVLYRTDLLFGEWLTNEVSVIGIEPETVSTAIVDTAAAFFKIELNQ